MIRNLVRVKYIKKYFIKVIKPYQVIKNLFGNYFLE